MNLAYNKKGRILHLTLILLTSLAVTSNIISKKLSHKQTLYQDKISKEYNIAYYERLFSSIQYAQY